MSNIEKDYTAAVQRLPPHLQRMASDLRSCRDMRGAWTLRDLDGNDLAPEPPATKSAAPVSGSRPVSSATFLRVCSEIGAMFGQVESRIVALESGSTKAATTRALPSGYITRDMSAPKPRYRHRDGAWIASGVSDILDATSRGAAP